MALKSTVFKLDLAISDLTRNYYQDHSLTLARHPSENDLRMLVRIIVFALNAGEHLSFTRGLANTEEPDLWQIDLTGRIQHWIDLGQPAEKRIRQSCSKADKVSIYSYQKGAALPWFESVKKDIERFEHLRVILLNIPAEKQVSSFSERSMNLTCVIDDQQIQLSNDNETISFEQEILKP